MMKLYNTLTKQIEVVEPLNTPRVSVYTCGPTVYDYPHVGNWFTFIRYDILIRTLKSAGYEPVWVLNITDVGHLVSDADEGEDKLEKGAKREGKSAWDVAETYSNYFIEGLTRLNFISPNHLPKATEHIAEQIELIEKLEELGYTYATSDGIYYDTRKFEGYSAFARLDLEDQQSAVRITVNTEKRQSSDFALWKFSPENQQRDMEWDSPWGKGFPGWHLECSAMILKLLGDSIDIHSGGIDHVSVHHTNEIAQSEPVTGKRLAQYWMHTNHVTVEGEKISKSLGNSITLEEIENKGIKLDAFRLHVLESHYRTQSKFTWDSLSAAANRLKTLEEFADLRFQGDDEASILDENYFEDNIKSVKVALEDDLNTPIALRIISEVITHISINGLLPEYIENGQFHNFLSAIDNGLGLRLLSNSDINDEQKQLILRRETARHSHDWNKSDDLRNQLIKQGIGLRDKPLSTIWYRL